MKDHFRILGGLLAATLAVAGARAQDSRAYAKEDVPLSRTLEAQNQTDAWKEVEKACDHFPASSHSETSGSLPAGDPRTKYIESWLVATADKAKEFYTKFPNDSHAAAAREKELDVLWQALDETYATNQFPRIFARATALFKDGRVDKAKRFDICNFIFMTALTRRSLLPANVDVTAELKEDVRILEKDFRGMGNIRLLSALAEDSKAETTRPILREMADIPGMPGLSYNLLLTATYRQREAIGKPLAIRFTALDGREVDTAVLKGKVVALDFWGISYPACITNVLRLEQFYEKYHAEGLEVIGVNVDHDSETLKRFISTHGIEWPQYWDGKEIGNKVVQNALVTRAGTILLIDKKGLLRDVNGDEGLDRKVEALLKEQQK